MKPAFFAERPGQLYPKIASINFIYMLEPVIFQNSIITLVTPSISRFKKENSKLCSSRTKGNRQLSEILKRGKWFPGTFVLTRHVTIRGKREKNRLRFKAEFYFKKP